MLDFFVIDHISVSGFFLFSLLIEIRLSLNKLQF